MFFINPFIYAAGADFESIATVTVGSGGASSIEFTSIPGTYQHLQIRYIGRGTSTLARAALEFNGSAASLRGHYLGGDGAAAFAGTTTGFADFAVIHNSSATANAFGVAVVDILDYATTSKNRVFRSLTGADGNGSGLLVIYSGLWSDTAAITSVTIKAGNTGSGVFAQHTTAALYGIKAP